MATSVKLAKIIGMIEVEETLSKTNLNGSTAEALTIMNKINSEYNLNSSTSPDAELVYMGLQSLSGGALTIDLTALTDSEGNTIASTGKKVRAILAKGTSTNAGAITIAVGASNGYELGGSAFSVDIDASDWFLAFFGTHAPDIAAGAKTLDCSGTTTESFKLIIVFG